MDDFATPEYAGRRVLTVGVFDILHRGHVELLRRALSLGSCLTVGVQTDRGAAMSKRRVPVNDLQSRMAVVGAVRYVDRVVAYDCVDALVEQSDFDLLVTGPDQTHGGFERAKQICRRRGIEHVVLPRTEGVSTTQIGQRIVDQMASEDVQKVLQALA